MPEIAIVSFNEKGFWQADYWRDVDMAELDLTGQAPDNFLTLAKGQAGNDAIKATQAAWPSARIYEASNEYDETE